MRCASYCTATSYQIDDLIKSLHSQGNEPKLYDQVIHIQKSGEPLNPATEKHIFYFSYGCVVFWNFTESEEHIILKDLQDYAISPLHSPILDICHYLYNPSFDDSKTHIKEEDDEIMLGSSDPLIKLSLSYGLSQSVKLTNFENTIVATIEKTKYLPEEMRVMGKTSLSRKKLGQMIGALFTERSSINLHSDILDTPEFFWRRPKYEAYYLMATEYLDINTRMDILNRRLSVIHELYVMLSSELQHIHSSHLEWIIVVLIMIEVLLVVVSDILHIF